MVGSYNFGQFRANQLSNYIKSIEHTLTDKKVESSLSKGNFFIDKAIEYLAQTNFKDKLLKVL